MYGNKLTTLNHKKVDYTTFVEQLEAKKIKSATVSGGSNKIVYELKGDNGIYYTNNPKTEDILEKILLKNVDVEIVEPSWLSLVIGYLWTPLLLGAFLFISFKGADMLGKVDVSDVQKKTGVSFNDVVGLDEVKEDLLEVANMLKNKKYKEMGIRVPKGILLEGPPGCGKTFLAKAFAGEIGSNFISVDACDFSSAYISVGPSKIKNIFKKAREQAPCIIFIDEFDAVGAKRTNQGDSASKEMNAMINALLTEMDGFSGIDDVMVLAATNRADALDKALVRPGRFDKILTIDLPDKQARIKLFEKYTNKKQIAEDVNFDVLAAKTFGLSCSAIETVVNEASINAIKNKHEKVEAEDFDKALLTLMIRGYEKPVGERDEYEKRTVAIHEAGHAFLAHKLCNKNITNISIRPTTSGAGGFTVAVNKVEGLKPLSHYMGELAYILGGRAAEQVAYGKDFVSTGASADIMEATEMAANIIVLRDCVDYAMFGDSGIAKMMDKTEEVLKHTLSDAIKVIEENWHTVTKIANKLIEVEVIDSELFEQLVAE